MIAVPGTRPKFGHGASTLTLSGHCVREAGILNRRTKGRHFHRVHRYRGGSRRREGPSVLLSDGPDGRMSGRLDDLAKGPLNLVGPKGAPTIDLKVPIAMIALGVDFAVHATRRYQEENSFVYFLRCGRKDPLPGADQIAMGA